MITATTTGAQLAQLLIDEGERRGLPICTVSDQVFGHRTQIYALQKGVRPPRPKTIDKARTWLAHAAHEGRRDGGGLDSRPAVPAPEPIAVPVTGLCLYTDLVRAAEARGMTVRRFAEPLAPSSPATTYLKQLKAARKPTQSTIDRVRALIAGDPLPELPPRNRMRAWAARETLPARPVAARPRRDPVPRLGQALIVGDPRFPESLRVEQPQTRIGERIRAIAADVDAEQRQDAIASGQPSFQQGLRQLTADWPDQWARVRAIASELGLVPGEAFRRVVAAGLTCFEEGDD